MSGSSPHRFDRRSFLAGASALGVASLLGSTREAAAEPPPETTRIRLTQDPAICLAPQYLAEELLRLEGFSEIEYATPEKIIAQGSDWRFLNELKKELKA